MLKISDYEIIRRPLLTEKTNKITEFNCYTFLVDINATKPMIKKVIEEIFNVNVVSVQTLIRKGKQKVFKGRRGQQKDKKHAMVRLAQGNTIDLTSKV